MGEHELLWPSQLGIKYGNTIIHPSWPKRLEKLYSYSWGRVATPSNIYFYKGSGTKWKVGLASYGQSNTTGLENLKPKANQDCIASLWPSRDRGTGRWGGTFDSTLSCKEYQWNCMYWVPKDSKNKQTRHAPIVTSELEDNVTKRNALTSGSAVQWF